MKQKTKFIASLIATIIVALCCFTPVLVILLGVLGLSALVGYLDYILIPALGILFSLTIYSYLRYQKSSKNRGKIMLENCCNETETKKSVTCPVNNQKGKPVKTTTLQSLIKAESLSSLNYQTNYFFCADETCPVVYFNKEAQTLMIADLKVPVFQKDKRGEVPVCYCFNWTRNRIAEEIKNTCQSSAEIAIREQVKAKNCACEINNPQGSCCLNNVHQFVTDYCRLA